MLVKKGGGFKGSEITPYDVYLNRRAFILGGAAAALALGPACGGRRASAAGQPLKATPNPAYKVDDPLTPFKDVTTYNNFYEFGIEQGGPGAARGLAQAAAVDGPGGRARAHKPKTFDIEDILKMAPLEERVYSPALRRGLVHGDPVDRLSRSPRSSSGSSRPGRPSTSSSRRSWIRSSSPARRRAVQLRRARLAVHRRAAPRRGDAPADAPDGRAVRPGAAEPERRADPGGGAVEVRLQERQVDRAHPAHRRTSRRPRGTRRRPSEYGFYSNVNPDGGPPALEPGDRAAHRRVPAPRRR